MRALLVVPVLLLVGISLAEETTTLPPLTEGSCLHGGVFNKEDATCACQSYWGERDCSKIECVNGGYPFKPTADENEVCHCPKGYYGIHCDAVKLARPVEGVFNMEKSFSLYIHNELTDWYGMEAFAAIQRNVKSILQDYSFDSYNWIISERGKPEKEFVKFSGSTSKKDFIDKVTAAQPKRTGMYTCARTDISYSSLLKTLQDNKIEDSVMLMFTQYPPNKDNDDQALADLKKYLRAFRIKLNVLIGSDDILLDCDSKKNNDKHFFEELTSLVHYTDGEIASYLIENEDDPDELLPAFIRASASPQSHARTASNTCAGAKGAELVFQTDPYPNTYYIAVRSNEKNPATISGTCSSGGEVSEAISSYNEEFTLFTIRSGAQQTCELFVITGTECIATVYSVGGEKDVDAFDIFHSFATTEDMDTDSISTYQDEDYFLTMHIEVPADPKYKIKRFSGTITVINEMEQDVLFEKNLTARGSTFEYQSEEKFPCPKDGTSWIQLNLNGFTEGNPNDPPVAVLNRMIPLNCEERKAGEVTPKMFRLLDESTPAIKRPFFAILYSNWLPIPQYSSFILASVDKDLITSRFSEFAFLRFDAKPQMAFDHLYKVEEFGEFTKNIYDFGPDKSLESQENLQQNLEQLTGGDPSLSSDSLVAIAVQHCPAFPNSYPSNLAALSNLGAKLLFLGDVDTVRIVNPSDLDSIKIFTKLAAVSAGHFVLMDMSDFDDDDPLAPFYVSLALRDLYSSGPSQRLLSYSNLEWEKIPGSTSQSKPIGTLQVPAITTEVFVSITLNVEDPKDVGIAFMLSIVLEGATDRIVLQNTNSEGDFTVYGTPNYVRSNLYTAKITVVEGESYEGTFTLLATTPYTGAHIRFWTERTEEDVIPDLNYVDFDWKNIQPNDFDGAALRVKGSEDDTIHLRFLDENGQEAVRMDNDQDVTVDSSNGANFIPYFCDAKQSDSLSKEMYTVEIKFSSTNFTYFRPMFCTASGKSNVDTCDVVDEDGNVFCRGTTPPFKRGPSGKLIDCSGVGEVYYENKAYKCACESGFSGLSCESSSCSADISHIVGEKDAAYRTLTFVFISPAGERDAACSDINQYFAADAMQLFQASSYDNIWQFTFLMYFNDGTVKTMYRGPRLSGFMNVFDILTAVDFDADHFCGEKNAVYKPIDIADVYKSAVESVGRDSRGIVFLYASQSFLDIKPEFQLDTLIVSEEFYQTVQAYQQHIYMISPVITKDIISLTTASGGVAIKMIDGFFPNLFTTSAALQVFENIIKGEIGWIGILTKTEDEQREWTIDGDVKVFSYSNSTHTLTDCGSGATPFTPEEFPYDEDDGNDITRSSLLYKIPASIEKICIDFDSTATEYDIIQVVVLSTESSIQSALIGQGQADVDKHSAGATTNSTMPIHISFNQPDEKNHFEPLIKNWREAARENCTFAQEFIPIENPFEQSGPLVVDFDWSKKDATGNVPFSSVSVPIVVTERIKCVNGNFVQGSYCKCDKNWSGPTCSQPSCGEGGVLNSHRDHCDCTGAEFGGVFCREEKASLASEEE